MSSHLLVGFISDTGVGAMGFFAQGSFIRPLLDQFLFGFLRASYMFIADSQSEPRPAAWLWVSRDYE